MTAHKHLKRLARARAAKTGERYAAALRHLPPPKEPAMTTNTTDTSISTCSFCSTPHTEVDKIFVGPGVYICSACVSRLHDIVAGTTPIPDNIPSGRDAVENAARQMPEDRHLAGLANHARVLDQVERDIRIWIRRALDRDVTWSDIADALNLSDEEARRRFSPPSEAD